jgi:hypothetical protein
MNHENLDINRQNPFIFKQLKQILSNYAIFLCIWDWTGIRYSDFVRKAVVVKGGLERSK